jgi:hypothetical protein
MNDSSIKCKALIKQGKNKGNLCCNKAKFGDFCGLHKIIELEIFEILPNNLSNILGNSSYEGLVKIKKIIIENWLKTHSREELQDEKIPISKETYNKILGKFNQETIVVDMIFIIKSKITKESKEPFYSNKIPKFPKDLIYYKFITTLYPENSVLKNEDYKSYKKFVIDFWGKMNQKVHSDGKIYIKESVFECVKTYIGGKIKNYMKSPHCTITKHNPIQWMDFIVNDIFSSKIDVNNTVPPKSTSPPPKNKYVAPPLLQKQKIFSIPKKKNINEELINLFPGKNINLFITVISTSSDIYAKTIKSKKDIHELYLQFHPDKCDNKENVIKLCNLFCSKVENIKKCFEKDNKKDIVHSPIRVRGNEIKILEDML